MLSSKNEAKQEGALRRALDVLSERVDTLASTVATTASAIAKKDGEIATLRRDLELRDQQLQSLARARLAGREPVGPAGATCAPAGRRGPAVRARHEGEARSSSTRSSSKLNLLAERLDTLSATVSTTAAGLAGRDGEIAAIRKHLGTTQVAGHAAPTANPDLDRQVRELGVNVMSTNARLDDHTAELEVVKAQLSEPHPHAEELRAMLTALRARVEALDSLRAGVTEEVLDERLAEPKRLSPRSGDGWTSSPRVSSRRTAGLAAEDVKLEALQRQVTDSSSAAESTAELRERLIETETALEAEGAARRARLPGRVGDGQPRRQRPEARHAGAPALGVGLADRGCRRRSPRRACRGERGASRRAARTDEYGPAGLSSSGSTSSASGVESATTSHADEEQRLEALHRQVTDSSSRIESIADDLRDALARVPRGDS